MITILLKFIIISNALYPYLVKCTFLKFIIHYYILILAFIYTQWDNLILMLILVLITFLIIYIPVIVITQLIYKYNYNFNRFKVTIIIIILIVIILSVFFIITFYLFLLVLWENLYTLTMEHNFFKYFTPNLSYGRWFIYKINETDSKLLEYLLDNKLKIKFTSLSFNQTNNYIIHVSFKTLVEIYNIDRPILSYLEYVGRPYKWYLWFINPYLKYEDIFLNPETFTFSRDERHFIYRYMDYYNYVYYVKSLGYENYTVSWILRFCEPVDYIRHLRTLGWLVDESENKQWIWKISVPID